MIIIFHCLTVNIICSLIQKAIKEIGTPKAIYRGPKDHTSVKCCIAPLTTPTPHAKRKAAIIIEKT